MAISVAGTYEAGFSAPGNAVVVGASDFLDAISDSSDSSYIRLSTNGSDESAVFVFGMQEVVDPGVDTGFTFRVFARYSDPLAVGPFQFSVQIGTQVAPFLFAILVNLIPSAESISFVEFEIPLTEEQVQNIRAEDGFGPFVMGVSGLVLGQILFSTFAGSSVVLDLSYAELEYPGAGPVTPDIEITSDAGLEFSGSNFFEILSDAGFIFNVDSVLLFNTIISDAGLVFGFSSPQFGNQITSDAGLVFDFSARDLILSADCSGIYTLIPGRHHDEILSRNTYDAETQDVKIPDPTGKTGFFGG